VHQRVVLATLIFLLNPISSWAAPSETQLAVWANEAIVATYTYSYKNYVSRQKEIAKYFSAEGWTNYLTALNASKLPEAVEKNSYVVSAVALLPPEVKTVKVGQWQATMPLLVLYKNPNYQQKQTLQVTITFVEQPDKNLGVRGFTLNSLQAKTTTPPCECVPNPSSKTNAETPSPNGAQSEKTKAL
jgi:hypothetical protein